MPSVSILLPLKQRESTELQSQMKYFIIGPSHKLPIVWNTRDLVRNTHSAVSYRRLNPRNTLLSC